MQERPVPPKKIAPRSSCLKRRSVPGSEYLVQLPERVPVAVRPGVYQAACYPASVGARVAPAHAGDAWRRYADSLRAARSSVDRSAARLACSGADLRATQQHADRAGASTVDHWLIPTRQARYGSQPTTYIAPLAWDAQQDTTSRLPFPARAR